MTDSTTTNLSLDDTISVTDLVTKTYAYPGGCEDGKTAYLEALGIVAPKRYLPQPLTINVEFQYRSGDYSEGRINYGIENDTDVPGLVNLRCTESESSIVGGWSLATAEISNAGAFMSFVGGFGPFEVRVSDPDEDGATTWMRGNISLVDNLA